ncbi:hypothetical protein AMS68_007551 [Peltaster fructicola]|uniref:FAD-binding FR-type domain-containing protein n=1 Tax=Peltaster fructicola TaxID=286661 RepID=A0A6H0Y4U1_9PEZI|nr:hypothetical protein AMS68_007551 [Peltaster fructicola]
MAFLQLQDMSWHQGELEMQKVMHVPSNDNPTVPSLSPQLANHLQIAPLVAIGVLKDGKPWTSVWGGESGLGKAIAQGVIGVRTAVPGCDPVVEELFQDGLVREEGQGRMVSGLTIDLEARKRVKFFGRTIVAALKDGEAQLVLKVEQSLGNCPKYLNKRRITSVSPAPTLISETLSSQALDLINKTDLFFITSSYNEDMDTNHRGGPPGFLRCVDSTLYWPEYSGNRLYQTLGNLKLNPLAGISVPDFVTGDMLYMTGRAEILVGDDAKILPKTNLAVKFVVESTRFVQQALPFRGAAGDPSPYNPTVRFLSTEKKQPQVQSVKQVAVLLRQEKLTPTVSRYRFILDSPAIFKPGQYVTFDFSTLLDVGYSHMREDDPRSLNDDFVRTFTVSSAPDEGNEFEITIRHVGVVTEYMSRYQGTEHEDRRRLEVGVMGFGGEFDVLQRTSMEDISFIAAGVGITPLLSALPGLDLLRVRLLWTIKAADVWLVVDTLKSYPGLASRTSVYVTGQVDGQARQELSDTRTCVFERRVSAEDVTALTATRTYICTSVPFRKVLLTWLAGHSKEILVEDFNF